MKRLVTNRTTIAAKQEILCYNELDRPIFAYAYCFHVLRFFRHQQRAACSLVTTKRVCKQHRIAIVLHEKSPCSHLRLKCVFSSVEATKICAFLNFFTEYIFLFVCFLPNTFDIDFISAKVLLYCW